MQGGVDLILNANVPLNLLELILLEYLYCHVAKLLAGDGVFSLCAKFPTSSLARSQRRRGNPEDSIEENLCYSLVFGVY
ncbi:MAG: hypothetical protein ACJAZX_001482 [Rickettsiales bacterium]|jgi:hypothetical protein